MTTALQQVLNIVGGGQELSVQLKAIGWDISYQAIQKWVKRGYVPQRSIIPVESAVKGAVNRYALADDFFRAHEKGINSQKESHHAVNSIAFMEGTQG